jgi:hypothetical protein
MNPETQTLPASLREASASTTIQKLALSELEGFTEDPVSARAFENRFFPLGMTTVLLCGGFTYYTVIRHGDLLLGGAGIFLGFCVAIISIIHARRAVPISRISGRSMLRFYRSDSPPDRTEMIYVDLDSRTYFCRTVAIFS